MDAPSAETRCGQAYFDAQEQIAQRRVQQVASACQAAGLGCETYTIEALHDFNCDSWE